MNDWFNSSYNGNINIKPKGLEVEWTSDMITEMAKCKNDPIYFAENYIKIVHVDKGLIDIDLYDYQREIIDAVTNGRRVVVNTSRQAGKTTTAAIVILHFVLFNKHKTVALLANKGDSAREILDRIQIAYQALPKWLQQGVVQWNKGSMELENGCKVIACSTSSSAIRGKSISFLYIDEAAFVEGWEEFFTSVFPTISSGKKTKILFTSTPNGLNHFYSLCEGAKDGRNGYRYIEVPWHRVPGRDDAWKDDQLRGLNFDIDKFNQEYNLEFLGSGDTLITGSKLKALVERQPLHSSESLAMYEKPVEGNIYTMTVDVSRGKGLDYSTFSVFDVTSIPYKQVCTYRNNTITPMDFANIIFRIAKNYNQAYVLVEINDIGGQVADSLHFDFEIEGLLYTESAGRAGKRIASGFGGKNVDRGIRTTSTSKNIGCNILKLLIENDKLIVRDKHTIDELKVFSRKGKSYEAQSGKHDDMVMTLVMFAWLTDQSFFKEITDINTLMELREKNEEQLLEELLPFGFTYDDLEVDDGMRVVDIDRDSIRSVFM